MSALARHLARLAVTLSPFMPVKSAELWAMLGAPGHVEDQRFGALESIDASAWKVRKGEPLFPRAEKAP